MPTSIRLPLLDPASRLPPRLRHRCQRGLIHHKWLRPDPRTTRLATALMVLLGLQLAIGFINLALAPVPLQLIHLLMADIVWVVFVLLSATTP